MSKSGQAALAAALVFTAQAACADVTPEDVWQSWQDIATAQGQTLAADQTATDGDTLTVTGLTLTGTDGTTSLDEVAFRDNGDGTVAIVFPDVSTLHLTQPAPTDVPGAGSTDLTLTVTAPDAEITASGVPLAINYDQNLPSVQIVVAGQGSTGPVNTTATLTEVTGKYAVQAAETGQDLTGAFAAKTFAVTGITTEAQTRADVSLSLNDMNGTLDITGIPATGSDDLEAALNAGMTLDAKVSYGIGAMDVSGTENGKPMKLVATLGGGTVDLAMDAGKFHYKGMNKALSLNIGGTDATTGQDFTFVGALADLASTLDIDGASWMNNQDFGLALKAGMKMAGGFGIGATSFDFAGGTADRPTKIKGSLAEASTAFAMDAAQIHYGSGSKAISFTLATPDIPLPELTFDLGEVAVSLVMPVAKSETPAPFTYLTRIIDLRLPEPVWAMVDPAGTLPHDAATVIIDTKGTATITRDLMQDAAALQAGAAEAPGLLNALDITQILARVAGAEVTAAGAFTFDNSDLTTFEGIPNPTGKIAIQALGVNALIDKLVAMGLVPQDQATQTRMMLSMFANTNPAADEMTSTLEFKDKHFFANGQQLQ